jgi:hypothetical protein
MNDFVTINPSGEVKFSLLFNKTMKTFPIQKHQRYIIGFDLERSEIIVCKDFSPTGKPIDMEIVKSENN